MPSWARAPNRRSSKRSPTSLGVADRVRFLTSVPDSDLPALYNCAELYLGLSRPAELLIEGFGIALVEASACGIPVVGGLAGGIPDAVRDRETGILVDSTDPRCRAGCGAVPSGGSGSPQTAR